MNTHVCLFGGALFAAGLTGPAHAQSFEISTSYGFADSTMLAVALDIEARPHGSAPFIDERFVGYAFNSISDASEFASMSSTFSPTKLESISTISDIPFTAYGDPWAAYNLVAVDVTVDLEVLAEWSLVNGHAYAYVRVEVFKVLPGMTDELVFTSDGLGDSGSQMLTLEGGSTYRLRTKASHAYENLVPGYSSEATASLTVIPAPGTALTFAVLLATRRRHREDQS